MTRTVVSINWEAMGLYSILKRGSNSLTIAKSAAEGDNSH